MTHITDLLLEWDHLVQDVVGVYNVIEMLTLAEHDQSLEPHTFKRVLFFISILYFLSGDQKI